MSGRTHRGSGSAPPEQLFLAFVASGEQQVLNAAWQDSVQKADASAAKRVEAGRKRTTLKVLSSKTLDIDWTRYRKLLDVPLLGHEASDLDVQPEAEPVHESAQLSEAPGDVQSEDWVLDDHSVAKLHESVLTYSLRVLKTRGNAQEKFEILQWIWSKDIYCWVTRNIDGANREVPIYSRQLPFTFQACCVAYGCNPEALREKLGYILKPLLKELNFESIVLQY